MTDFRKFEPHRLNLTRKDRKEMKRIIVDTLLSPNLAGIDLQDVAEWHAAMNDYPQRRREYLKELKREQRSLDT